MFRRPRKRRRGPYALSASRGTPPIVKYAVLLLVVGTVLFGAGRVIMGFFGSNSHIVQSKAIVRTEGNNVNVSLDGSELRTAEDGMPLHKDDRLVTGGASAVLKLFDGSIARLDAQSDITLEESGRGTEESLFHIRVDQGSMWMATPMRSAFTGSIAREVRTPQGVFSLPSGTELLLTPSVLYVYAADGEGVRFTTNQDRVLTIGEGQQFTLSSNLETIADPYTLRSPLLPDALMLPFVADSRTTASSTEEHSVTIATVKPDSTADILVVSAPEDDTFVDTSTIEVVGQVNEQVVRVRVNGYQAELNPANNTFSQELALPDEEEVVIRIEALDSNGVTLQEARRTVKREIKPPEAPTIISPAPHNSVYRTQNERFEITGGAPEGAYGIIVNDYRLQLFKPGDKTWNYLASVKLENIKPGRNEMKVVTIDRAGNLSEPAVLVILLEEGVPGIVSTIDAPETPTTETPTEEIVGEEEIVEEVPVLNNDPLLPGTLTIDGPTPGNRHTHTGAVIVLEGTVPASTASIWVNEYQLQLFTEGSTSWRFIARDEWGTLKNGENRYEIVIRNNKGEVLDRSVYLVNRLPLSEEKIEEN